MSEYVTLLPPRVRRAKRCPVCSKAYDAVAWAMLPNKRLWKIDDVWLELAECTARRPDGETCAGSMSVELEQ